MVSAQQTNLLPGNTSQNDFIFAQSPYRQYRTTGQCLTSYGCVITILYGMHATVRILTGMYFSHYASCLLRLTLYFALSRRIGRIVGTSNIFCIIHNQDVHVRCAWQGSTEFGIIKITVPCTSHTCLGYGAQVVQVSLLFLFMQAYPHC